MADFGNKTKHLTMLETGAFDLLLDEYYAKEKPLPKNREKLYRICKANSPEEQLAVEDILEEFWIERESGYINKRAKSEINTAQSAIKAARENGKKGGRPKTQKKPSGFSQNNPELTQPLTQKNQPLTSILQPPSISQDHMVEEDRDPVPKNAISSSAISAFGAMDCEPYGTPEFQYFWAKQYNECKSGSWADAMERTIQECKAAGISVPGRFYTYKHQVEKFEAGKTFKSVAL